MSLVGSDNTGDVPEPALDCEVQKTKSDSEVWQVAVAGRQYEPDGHISL